MKNPKQPQEKPAETPPEGSTSVETPEPPKDSTPEKEAAKIAELTADLQRTRADFENYRKNVEKDRENAKKLARLATVEKFLPLLDDLDRAFSAYSELKPLEKNFEKSLKNLGLEKINSGEKTEFNPELHEAVMTEGSGEKETISETLRAGYLYDGEVLRPAMVKVKMV